MPFALRFDRLAFGLTFAVSVALGLGGLLLTYQSVIAGQTGGCGTLFCDAHVYLRALARHEAGEEVYLTADPLRFVYPPIFLKALSGLSPYAAAAVFGALAALSVAAFVAAAGLRGVAALGAALANGFIGFAIVSGNLALPLHLLLIALILLACSSGSGSGWAAVAAWATIMAAALMKPYFLAYLPILFARDADGLAVVVRRTVFSLLAFAAVTLLDRAQDPALYARFIEALRSQLGSDGEQRRSLMGLAETLGAPPAAALALHALAAGALMLAAMARWKTVRGPSTRGAGRGRSAGCAPPRSPPTRGCCITISPPSPSSSRSRR